MIERLHYRNAHDFKDCKDAVKLSDKEVQNLIDEVMEDLRHEGNSYAGTGDTMVFGFRYEDEIDVFVCRNYEEGQLLKEKDGTWSKLDWLYNYEQEEDIKDITDLLNDLPKEQLIDILKKVLGNGSESNDGRNNNGTL